MPAPAVAAGRSGLVATASTYHRASCRTIQGRADLEPVEPDDAAAEGLAACRVCRPEALSA